ANVAHATPYESYNPDRSAWAVSLCPGNRQFSRRCLPVTPGTTGQLPQPLAAGVAQEPFQARATLGPGPAKRTGTTPRWENSL
ncbi:hypothetical protein, partial [Pseudomonas sp. FEN]